MIQILENQLWILGLLYWIVKHWRRISCIAVLASEIDALRLSASVMRCGQSIGMAWSQCVTETTPQKSWELFLQTGAQCLASQKWTAPCNRHRWLRNYTKIFLQCPICPWFVLGQHLCIWFWNVLKMSQQTSIGWRQVCLEHAPYEARAHVDGSRGIWDFPLRLQKETWTSWIGAGPVLNKTFTLLNKNMQIPCVVRGSGNFKALLGLGLFKQGEPQMVWTRAASCTRPIWKNCVKERREQYRSSRLYIELQEQCMHLEQEILQCAFYSR